MKKFGYFLLALACPWLLLLITGQSGKAFIAFILQASLLGWPFATFLAWRAAQEDMFTSSEEAVSKTTSPVKESNKKG